MNKTNEEMEKILAEIKDVLWDYTYIKNYGASLAMENILYIFIREGIING